MKVNIKVVLILLIIFHSAGIRYFPGQGITLGLLLLLFMVIRYPNSLFSSKNIILIPVLILFIPLCIRSVSLEIIKQFVVLTLSLLNAYLLIQTYNNDYRKGIKDVHSALYLIFIHSLISVLLIPLPKTSFFAGLNYNTIFYLFNYTGTSLDLLNNSRITGFIWEPGLLQFFLNLLLFIEIRARGSLIKIFLISVTILFTFSTTGFIILLINAIYFLLQNKLKVKYLAIIGMSGLMISSIFYDNIYNKFSGKDRSSSLIRIMNMNMAYNLMLDKPLIGHGLKSGTFYYNNDISYNTMLDYTDKKSLEALQIENLGLTNGLFQVGVFFGAPCLIILLYGIYRQRFLELDNKLEKTILFLLIIISSASEPIFLTSFFLIFPLSSIPKLKMSLSLNQKVK